MMQITSTVPAHNLHKFQALRCPSFRCHASSPLNPSVNKSFTSLQTHKPFDSTRLHLSNLDKFLDSQNPLESTTQHHHHQQQQQPIQKNDSKDKKGKSFLECLNLAKLWPEIKAADEISPRHLKRLQRLLSKTAEYSPRNILGSRWKEYHGSNDWKGMLDPLDDNLRREVVRYGDLVQAAYQAFHADPAMSSTEPPQHHHVALPERSYKVTKSLYATSSIGLPKWIDDVAPDLGWMTQHSSWVGYVAVCDDRREIARMGRRDIVISLRGTSTCLEWAENMRAQLIDLPVDNNNNNNNENSEARAQTQGKPKVECGFMSLYKTRGAHVPSLSESVVEEVKRLMELYKGEELSITITGHSLGATLALLVAEEISTCGPNVPPVAVFSFGGPRVGNKAFGEHLTQKKVKVLRIVNTQDVITRVPGIFLSEELEEKIKNSKVVSGVVDMLEENTPLGYSHVGTELRVNTKMSPYLKPDADIACCHDLEAYLHLVDGFIASNCPFRANAKRSLARLMQDQSSNVKKLYTSKAKALTVNLSRQRSMSMSTCLPSPSSS
ncbi:phospholipase A1-Ibeta2, chloroplastic-like [Cicer arietinum]|uniref:Phospholipase A1-Ibeta2, chloroplastic-like n=1 Tax=Cicer arietinum TaxID=3827 RepID=A0A1S2YXZ2_CICAR|nr:phospholipase A1-Ibeta2, chloroplastic-like [Cicer arietinum]